MYVQYLHSFEQCVLSMTFPPWESGPPEEAAPGMRLEREVRAAQLQDQAQISRNRLKMLGLIDRGQGHEFIHII
jgi:hypothetical protein